MTTKEAAASLGKKFILDGFGSKPDTIIKVQGNIVHGNFIEAPADSCALYIEPVKEKKPVPPGLQRWLDRKAEEKKRNNPTT